MSRWWGKKRNRAGGGVSRTEAGGIWIQVKQTSHTEVDYKRAASLMSSLAIGHVKRRTAAGTDIHGRPFRPYSPGYRQKLIDAGQDPNVNLMLTGGMVGSVQEKGRRVSRTMAQVIIGPGTGTSPAVSLGRTARRTSRRGPPHNIVGGYHQRGAGSMPARKWLGLSPKGRKQIADALKKKGAGVLKTKKGPPR